MVNEDQKKPSKILTAEEILATPDDGTFEEWDRLWEECPGPLGIVFSQVIVQRQQILKLLKLALSLASRLDEVEKKLQAK